MCKGGFKPQAPVCSLEGDRAFTVVITDARGTSVPPPTPLPVYRRGASQEADVCWGGSCEQLHSTTQTQQCADTATI